MNAWKQFVAANIIDDPMKCVDADIEAAIAMHRRLMTEGFTEMTPIVSHTIFDLERGKFLRIAEAEMR